MKIIKRIIALVLMGMVALSMTACESSNNNTNQTESPTIYS